MQRVFYLAVMVVAWSANPLCGWSQDFRDVMAVLSKASCNAGACHGNQNGKNGFRLSLRGEDPNFDYQSLVRDYASRRIDPMSPAESLFLLKPTGRLAHQGGVRFSRDSLEYRILHDWISAGAPPPDPAQPAVIGIEVHASATLVVAPVDAIALSVSARLADGSQRDVTPLAVYEPATMNVEVTSTGEVRRRSAGEATVLVRYLQQQAPVRLVFLDPQPDYHESALEQRNYIDLHVNAKLRELQIVASPQCDDGTFVRRVYLDALGVLPTAEEAQRFCADERPDKRDRLVDHLLARPEFADHWALKWSDLLRNEEKVLDHRGVEAFYQWIHASMARGQPLDQFVREMIQAQGSTYQVPPANYYRANRDPTTRAETTARLFLGTRLQCARCHNHPYDRWTQDDYYAWASCFAGIEYDIIKNERRDEFDKNEFVGEQLVRLEDGGAVQNPRLGQDAAPRYLGAGHTAQTGPERLSHLASWLTSADNPWFARVMANLIWYHTMGRGLVEPLDDFRVTNPPSHPALLDALADDLVRHNFDLRYLMRMIMTSAAYQRSSAVSGNNAGDQHNYARAMVRRLTAEQLLDAQAHVLRLPNQFANYPAGLRAGQIRGVRNVRERDEKPTAADRFLKSFGKPDRLLACECERSNETTLNQIFLLIASEDLHARLADPHNRLHALATCATAPEAGLEELFWTALSRPPTTEEQARCLGVVLESGERFTALQDIAWSLMNSKEFLFRH